MRFEDSQSIVNSKRYIKQNLERVMAEWAGGK